MKLAEAIMRSEHIRQDMHLLLKSLSDSSRNVDKVLREIEKASNTLENLCGRISKTIMQVKVGDNLLSDIMNKRDYLKFKIEKLKDFVNKNDIATPEIINDWIQRYQKAYRELDISIAQVNWTVDLIDG